MSHNTKLPPMPQALEPDLEDHEYELWGQNVKADFVTVEKAIAYAREAVRLNAQAVPDWVPVTQQLLNSQEPWLYKTCWLAFPSGAVLTGVYEWRQGRNPDRFISAEVGDVWAFDVSHVMPVTPPPHPDMLSAAPAAPQPAQPLDAGVMELAESVGLIGPASRAHDLHEAIQRFHDLIVVNASIKAALHFADGLAKPTQPLTDEQCDAIYMALNDWAREFDEYEFGLPHSCGGGVEGGREIIRKAHGIGVKND